jgi:hypothetical protein
MFVPWASAAAFPGLGLRRSGGNAVVCDCTITEEPPNNARRAIAVRDLQTLLEVYVTPQLCRIGLMNLGFLLLIAMQTGL